MEIVAGAHLSIRLGVKGSKAQRLFFLRKKAIYYTIIREPLACE